MRMKDKRRGIGFETVAGMGGGYRRNTPDYVHIPPAPAATDTPSVAPVPASDDAAPAPLRNPPALIPDRVVRELGHETDVRMSGRTQGETRAMRGSPHAQHGPDVSCRFGARDSHPRGVRRGLPRA